MPFPFKLEKYSNEIGTQNIIIYVMAIVCYFDIVKVLAFSIYDSHWEMYDTSFYMHVRTLHGKCFSIRGI